MAHGKQGIKNGSPKTRISDDHKKTKFLKWLSENQLFKPTE
jgi:hypothetical protein